LPTEPDLGSHVVEVRFTETLIDEQHLRRLPVSGNRYLYVASPVPHVACALVGLAFHNANLAPTVEGEPIQLAARHAKVRLHGYCK
jgi:hypothetical protein